MINDGMDMQSSLEAATGATGLGDPTLSYNLDRLSDYAVGMPLLDLMKASRDWLTYPASSNASDTPGLFDDQGWPTEMPAGTNKFTKIWDWSNQPLADESREGVYQLSYEGEGTIVVRGAGVQVLSQEDGKITFEVVDTKSLIVDITATDPDGTGNHLRDISIVREEYVELYEAGAVFNPEWMSIVDDARELRMILWMETNRIDRNAETLEWEDRPQVTDASWATNGAPVEVLVQLANEAGIDPYFTINHNWSDDYIREFATYVRDNLDPKLKAKYEWSNEVWNGLFEQHHYVAESAEAEWGERDVFGYYTKLAVNMAQILDEVYAEAPDAQMAKVLGGFTPNTWISERILNGTLWAEHEPDLAIAAADVFDELAVAHYFGSKALRFEENRAELLNAINDPSVDANAWFAAQLMTPGQDGSIPEVLDELVAQKAMADKYGVDLTLYEGGQHVHHQFGIANVDNVLSSFLADFVRGEEMAELYQALWDGWAEIGDGAFMNFAATGGISQWGSWGVYASLDDSTPRSERIEQLNAETGSWWDEGRQYDTFHQGIIREGTQQDDLLIGTREEDYLIGSDGDDVLTGGAGDDGLHGGGGYDVAMLNGTLSDYRIEREGDGHRLTGPDGSDYLIDVEELAFADGTRISVADFLQAQTGEVPSQSSSEDIHYAPGNAGGETMETSLSDDVLFVGHSLVGFIPEMLQDIVSDSGGTGTLTAQIQNGAPLRWNWQESERAQVDALSVLPDGEIDILILTEAVPLDPNLKFNKTEIYAADFYNLAVDSNPFTQVYMYETWHSVWSGTDRADEIPYKSGDGDLIPWRDRIDQDLEKWEGVVDYVNAQRGPNDPEMLLIPAGQALGNLSDAIDAGTVPGLTSIEDVFSDDIHLNDLGQYFVAMVHYATIYGQDPVGLDAQLQGRFGADFDAPSAALAAVFQDIAWETATEYDRSGVSDGSVSPDPTPPVPAPDPNAAPDAVFDKVIIDQDQTVQITVLDNDTDADSDTLSILS
ncbi:MAG: hypothetical protein AAGB04_21485, partial [Pseudomonadota bacterium]